MRTVSMALIGLLVASAAWAANMGDQLFPFDLKDKARSGVVYENVARDIEVTSDSAKLKKVEYDALYLRINTDIGDSAYLDFDVGGADVSGGDTTYYVGAGLRLLAFDSQHARATATVQLHYLPMEFKRHGVSYDADFVEVEGGMFLGLKSQIAGQMQVIPYVGPVVSVVRLDGDAAGADFDAEEENLLGVAAGVSLHLREQHGVQAELRYFGSLSFSLGVSVAF